MTNTKYGAATSPILIANSIRAWKTFQLQNPKLLNHSDLVSHNVFKNDLYGALNCLASTGVDLQYSKQLPDGVGRHNQVILATAPRVTTAAVQNAHNCTTTALPANITSTLSTLTPNQIAFPIDPEATRLLQPTAWAGNSFGPSVNEGIKRHLNALHTVFNNNLLTLLGSNVGNHLITGTNAPVAINVLTNATEAVVQTGFSYIIRELLRSNGQGSEYDIICPTGSPIQRAFAQLAINNSNGSGSTVEKYTINVLGVTINCYPDNFMSALYPANRFFLIKKGAAKMLGFSRFAPNFDVNTGIETFRESVENLRLENINRTGAAMMKNAVIDRGTTETYYEDDDIPGMIYDLTLDYANCNSATPSTYGELRVRLRSNTGWFFTPNLYLAGDNQFGSNGIWQFDGVAA